MDESECLSVYSGLVRQSTSHVDMGTLEIFQRVLTVERNQPYGLDTSGVRWPRRYFIFSSFDLHWLGVLGALLHRLAGAVKAGSGFGAFSAFSTRRGHPESDIITTSPWYLYLKKGSVVFFSSPSFFWGGDGPGWAGGVTNIFLYKSKLDSSSFFPGVWQHAREANHVRMGDCRSLLSHDVCILIE
jgi:hypothetical protein